MGGNMLAAVSLQQGYPGAGRPRLSAWSAGGLQAGLLSGRRVRQEPQNSHGVRQAVRRRCPAESN